MLLQVSELRAVRTGLARTDSPSRNAQNAKCAKCGGPRVGANLSVEDAPQVID